MLVPYIIFLSLYNIFAGKAVKSFIICLQVEVVIGSYTICLYFLLSSCYTNIAYAILKRIGYIYVYFYSLYLVDDKN